ncbi:MAG: LysM peptidoglycan-binding domain-containing protein [Alphaproteobacteria bacterium]|nr:MAG: LysM peptidoglycan-binding domain-containing protein [Alphaproteobacteria bacterium]
MKNKICRVFRLLLCFGLSAVVLSGCTPKPKPEVAVTHHGMNTAEVAGTVLVHRDDTVYTIAKNYNLNPAKLIEENGLNAPYTLVSGQRLSLPQPRDYRVRERDTLYSIAQMFRVDINGLVRMNNLSPPYRIAPGQLLRLPDSYAYTSTTAYALPQNTQPGMQPAVYQNSDAVSPNARISSRSSIETQDLSDDRYESTQTTWLDTNRNSAAPARVLRSPTPPSAAPQQLAKPHKASGADYFIWPVKGKILSDYGPKEGGLHNDGINIGAPGGTPVKAAADGTVVYVGDELSSFGNLVLVRHGNGWVSAYGHLQNAGVSRGDTVKRGQVLGTVGKSGNVAAPQLHFELRQGRNALNPRQHLS